METSSKAAASGDGSLAFVKNAVTGLRYGGSASRGISAQLMPTFTAPWLLTVTDAVAESAGSPTAVAVMTTVPTELDALWAKPVELTVTRDGSELVHTTAGGFPFEAVTVRLAVEGGDPGAVGVVSGLSTVLAGEIEMVSTIGLGVGVLLGAGDAVGSAVGVGDGLGEGDPVGPAVGVGTALGNGDEVGPGAGVADGLVEIELPLLVEIGSPAVPSAVAIDPIPELVTVLNWAPLTRMVAVTVPLPVSQVFWALMYRKAPESTFPRSRVQGRACPEVCAVFPDASWYVRSAWQAEPVTLYSTSYVPPSAAKVDGSQAAAAPAAMTESPTATTPNRFIEFCPFPADQWIHAGSGRGPGRRGQRVCDLLSGVPVRGGDDVAPRAGGGLELGPAHVNRRRHVARPAGRAYLGADVNEGARADIAEIKGPR